MDPTEIPDIEQHAKDRIIKYIQARFSGHNLARLIEAILKAKAISLPNQNQEKMVAWIYLQGQVLLDSMSQESARK